MITQVQLIDAPGEGRAGNPEFYYDRGVSRYRYRDSGQFVSREAMLNLTRGRINSVQREMDRSVDDLVAGRINFRQFQIDNIERVKLLHSQQLLLGRGGVANTKSEDWLWLARELKQNQYPYFHRFMQDIKKGNLSEAQVRERLKMYARTSRRSYGEGRRASYKDSGMNWERRLLGSCRHCPDCLGYSRQGWQPIGQLPLPAQNCRCLGNCCCSMEYK